MEFLLHVFITARTEAEARELAEKLAEQAEGIEDAHITADPSTWFSFDFGALRIMQ